MRPNGHATRTETLRVRPWRALALTPVAYGGKPAYALRAGFANSTGLTARQGLNYKGGIRSGFGITTVVMIRFWVYTFLNTCRKPSPAMDLNWSTRGSSEPLSFRHLRSCTSGYNPGFSQKQRNQVTYLFLAFISKIRASRFVISLEITSNFLGARYQAWGLHSTRGR